MTGCEPVAPLTPLDQDGLPLRRALPGKLGVQAAGKLRILVISRSYPAAADLYRYPFVHRRVRAYQAAGHDVAVFRPAPGEADSTHSFDSVDCTSGGAPSLDALAVRFRPDVLAVHGLGPAMWPIVRELAGSMPMAAWLHGSEISGFLRRKSLLDGKSPDTTRISVDACSDFWRSVLHDKSSDRRLIFPSQTAVEYAEEGVTLEPQSYAVIPNPIDTELFAYTPKSADQRFHVLMIRPFDSRAYGNDLAVEAILRLKTTLPEFERMRFTICGDGPLFDDTLAPLHGLANVAIRRGFLTQQEIAAKHRLNGIFLVPTRLDTHGVSRDEAMASGLVPVTNAIAPIDEFVDDNCAALAAPDDAHGLAAALESLVREPENFLSKSAQAARRIRSGRSGGQIIPEEISLLRELLNG
jgi:glycosyltransferase involved in cell wall biosynthesis